MLRNLPVSNIAQVKLENLSFPLALNSLNRPGKTALPKHPSIWHSSAEKHSHTQKNNPDEQNKLSRKKKKTFLERGMRIEIM